MSAAATITLDFPAETGPLFPPMPETLEDTGLQQSVVEQLIFKMLYFRGDLLGRDLSTALGLKFSLIEDLVETMKRQYTVQVKRSLGMGNSTAVFALSEAGRNIAREYLGYNQYTGPAPVPLFQYNYFVRHQRRKEGWLSPEALAHAYRRMVVTPRILSQIGPAVRLGQFVPHLRTAGQWQNVPGRGFGRVGRHLYLSSACARVPGQHHSVV